MDNIGDNLISEIECDEFYKDFLQSTQKSLPQSLTIAEQVKKLGEGTELISKELQRQVLERYNDLLLQGSHATKLEDVLNIINGHIQNLCANAEKLRSQIAGPYNALETHTKVLGRLHLASHILRQVNRIQQLSKRLNNTTDPIQKATILHELEQLACDSNLKDIDAVTSELRNIRTQQQKVVMLATGSLNQGTINENTAQTATALQIFMNLHTLNATIQNLMDNSLSECRDIFKASFEFGNISSSSKLNKGPGKATFSSSQGFRAKIWVELENAFGEEMYRQCKQVKFLQITMNDTNAQDIDCSVASNFWSKLGLMLQSEIKNLSPALQQMLDEDYPKLLKCYHDMCEKLKYEHFTMDRQILDKCENAYLSSSLNQLLDVAQSMFNVGTDVPSHDLIDSLVRAIASDLSLSLIEQNLCEKVCKNVSKCIKMFALKTEQQIETGPEAAQVIAGNANSGQQRNVQLANALYYFQVQILRILSNMRESLPGPGVNTINESLQVVVHLIEAIIQPIVVSINSTIETIIVTIHLETDWGKLQTPPTKNVISSTPYMRELTQFINRVYNTYLSHFDNKEVLFSKCTEIAVRCIELFVRHASLLRPLSQGGRVRLQCDYTNLEQSLKVICPQLTDLGRPYRLLKSMASLVALSPQEIVASQVSESSVPHSTILLMLFSFAGSELASPHQTTAWSIPKLSVWLDEHPSETERLDLIAGALQRYEGLVRQENSMNYDPVYPIMSRFLESAVNLNSK